MAVVKSGHQVLADATTPYTVHISMDIGHPAKPVPRSLYLKAL
jgi:hypothetical protein